MPDACSPLRAGGPNARGCSASWPNTEPPVLDPVTNTAAQTRTHAFLVWDTLYGLDTDYAPHPTDGGRPTRSRITAANGTLTLRPELRFHDGQPVLSRDVIASIRRWARS